MSIEENRKKEMGFPKNPDNITKDELHQHFDLNNDGKVSIEEYAEHINYHCDNPETLDDELQQADFERGFKYEKGGKTTGWFKAEKDKMFLTFSTQAFDEKGDEIDYNEWWNEEKADFIDHPQELFVNEILKLLKENNIDINNNEDYDIEKGNGQEYFNESLDAYIFIFSTKNIKNKKEFNKKLNNIIKKYPRIKTHYGSKWNYMWLYENFAKGGITKEAKTWKEKYNKKYGNDLDASNSLSDIAEDTGVSKKGIQKIYNKGIGAYKTNPSSVRPNVKSKEQWAQARVYSAVMGGKAAKVDKKELKMERGGALKKEFKFDKNFVIYVPSTTDVGEKISKKELEERVQEVEKYVANEFGGYTETETDGGYKSTSGEIIEEDIVKVSVFANNKDWKKNENKVVKKVKEWSKKWGQEAIGFEFEGDLYYIDADGKFGWGGTILGALVGGYAGYKIGRARPQKKGFDTEKELISRAKNTRWEKDGGISYAKGGKTEYRRSKKVLQRIVDKVDIDGERPSTAYYYAKSELNSPSYAKGGYISMQERNEFENYLNDFYGKGGIYEDDYDGGFTTQEIAIAVDKYIQHPKSNWGGGDSVDRELTRDRFLIPEKYPNRKTEYKEGGEIDYFEQYERLEKEYPAIYNIVMEQEELTDYNDTERLLYKLNSMGWTFDYGLDNSPFNLRKMDKGGALELVHAYDDDGSLFGTGHIEKVEGGKTYVRFDSQKVKAFDNDKVKLVMEKGGRVYEITNIKYDTDDDYDLPKTLKIEVPSEYEGYEADEYISDKISDKTGFTHLGYSTTPDIEYEKGGKISYDDVKERVLDNYGYSVQDFHKGMMSRQEARQIMRETNELYLKLSKPKREDLGMLKYAKGGSLGKFGSGSIGDTNTIVSGLKKGDTIEISYGDVTNNSNNVPLKVRSRNKVRNGKIDKITFDYLSQPQSVKFYAYERGDGKWGFAKGDMAISRVTITKKYDKGGSVRSPYGYNKGGLTASKAKKMLDDGMAQGKPLTDRQKRYFGAISQGKADKAREKSSMKRGGKTKSINYKKKDYGLDYLYNQLKISRELLDRATTADEKDILSLRLESIQKVIDNTLKI